MADQKQAMPKVMPMPAPVARPNRVQHDAYAEEAMRVAQRHIDQITEIDRLGQELEEWRRRAMLAEAEVKRLEKREHDMQNMLDNQRRELIDDRDAYRNRLNNLVAQFHTAGAIILKCLEAAEGSSGPMVNLTSLAIEVEKEQKMDAMPSVVTTGPRNPDA